jgi:hypothetical protein
MFFLPPGSRSFVVWLVLRTTLWTLLALSQPHPPLDTVEWLAWGRHWQAGYHKHPPLAAWLAESAACLTPGSFLGVYLAGYLCVALALVCVYRLARELLPPREALAATVCLDGLVYFTRDAAEFNNQVVLAGFWALVVWCFRRAVVEDRLRWWIATGVALGLALWCKYSALFLAVPLCGYWLWHAGGRGWSRPLLVALAAGVVFGPHLAWLVEHDFATLRYAAARVQGSSGALDHRLSGLGFLLSQAVRLLPVMVILLPVLRWPLAACGLALGIAPPSAKPQAARGDLAFLLVVVLGPVALHVAAALLLGTQLRDVWGMPLWSFAGVLVVFGLGSDPAPGAWRRFAMTWAGVAGVLALVTLAGNRAGSALRQAPLRIHYPGRELSRQVCRRWRERFGTPLPVAAGDWWLAGCVCIHARHRLTLYGSREPAWPGMDLDRLDGDPARFVVPEPATSPWTSDADLLHRGGVLLWDAGTFGAELPAWLARRFPRAVVQETLELPFAGEGRKMLRVGWALLAPEGSDRASCDVPLPTRRSLSTITNRLISLVCRERGTEGKDAGYRQPIDLLAYSCLLAALYDLGDRNHGKTWAAGITGQKSWSWPVISR